MSILGLVCAIVGLALLVVVHEAGHFLAARRFGIAVERASLFFGRALLSKRRGDTEYQIGWLPLGGYVRLLGAARPERTLRGIKGIDEHARRRLHELANELAGAGRARARAILAEAERHVSSERDRALLGRAKAALEPSSWWSAPAWKRAAVACAGPLASAALAVLLLASSFMLGVRVDPTARIASVEAGSRAERAGIVAGAHVIRVNNRPVSSERLVRAFAEGRSYTLEISSPAGERRLFSGGPKQRLGIHLAPRRRYEGPLEAARLSLNALWWVTIESGGAIARVGQGKVQDEIAGPVGIARIEADVAVSNPRFFPGLLGLISFSLALVNLLPFAPLDGALVLLALTEHVRRRRLSERVELVAYTLGLLVVGSLFACGLFSDLAHLL